jgi:hypothetical protein
MAANIVGLIVLDSGLACHDALAESASEVLPRTPVDPLGTDTLQRSGTTMYETTFVRADMSRLQHELQSEFDQLLVRLFESA